MELKDTVKLMLSDDWHDRLKAEYLQTAVRYNKLTAFLDEVDKGQKKSKGVREATAMNMQKNAMEEYMIALEMRMEKAGIEFIPFDKL